jgi:hypothetical protein
MGAKESKEGATEVRIAQDKQDLIARSLSKRI